MSLGGGGQNHPQLRITAIKYRTLAASLREGKSFRTMSNCSSFTKLFSPFQHKTIRWLTPQKRCCWHKQQLATDPPICDQIMFPIRVPSIKNGKSLPVTIKVKAELVFILAGQMFSIGTGLFQELCLWGGVGSLECRSRGGGRGEEDIGYPRKYVNICPSLQPWPDYHFFCFCKQQPHNGPELWPLLAAAFPTSAPPLIC